MASTTQTIAGFRRRGLVRGGELYLSVSEAIAYAKRCREKGLAVIGVEGFYLSGDALVPQQDLIADASRIEADTWQAFQQKSNRFTADFLHQLTDRRGLVVNLTTLSEEEWRVNEPEE